MEIENIANQLMNKEISQVNISASTGSIFSLETISGETLMVNCSWRLVQDEKIFISWKLKSSAIMIGILKNMKGSKIVDVFISNKADLNLLLSNGILLNIFCDNSKHDIIDSNWYLKFNGRLFYIDYDMTLKEEK